MIQNDTRSIIQFTQQTQNQHFHVLSEHFTYEGRRAMTAVNDTVQLGARAYQGIPVLYECHYIVSYETNGIFIRMEDTKRVNLGRTR